MWRVESCDVTGTMGQNTSTAVLDAVNTMTKGAFASKDPLNAAGSCVFDDKALDLCPESHVENRCR